MLKVKIAGLPKPAVLKAFYDEVAQDELSLSEAEVMLGEMSSFYELKGVLLKIDLSADTHVDTYLYDKMYGRGRGHVVINKMKNKVFVK